MNAKIIDPSSDFSPGQSIPNNILHLFGHQWDFLIDGFIDMEFLLAVF
jgi:hypothetical protein